MQRYRVEVNIFGNAFNVEKRVGHVWLPVIMWLNEETANAWQRRLEKRKDKSVCK